MKDPGKSTPEGFNRRGGGCEGREFSMFLEGKRSKGGRLSLLEKGRSGRRGNFPGSRLDSAASSIWEIRGSVLSELGSNQKKEY